MHVLARAMRGPTWLAWLSLLFATQIAAADPVAGPDTEEGPDRAAVHAIARPRPLAAAAQAADAAGASRHEVAGNPAVVTVGAAAPPAARGRAARDAARRLASRRASVPLQPRAPPFFAFL